MRIESITIKNLLSFKYAEFNFKKYNVIVGPNNAGKTNLVRILQALADSNLTNFSSIQQMKRDDGGKPQIQIAVETTDEETRLIMQTIIDKDIKQDADLSSWRNFTIGLGWPSLGTDHHTELILIYFQNHAIVSINYNERRMSYHAPPDMPDFEQCLDRLCDMDAGHLIGAVHEGHLMPVKEESVRDLITDGPLKFFSNEEHRGISGRGINIDASKMKRHKRELVEYIDIPPHQTEFSLQHLISKIIRNSFLRSNEMHPASSRLTADLHRLKNSSESAYNHLQESFTNIFPDTEVKVEQKDPGKDKSQAIWITERGKTFEIDNSASGYLEAIHILYAILDRTQRTIFLDEPEVHFHPAKIRQISQMLSSLTKESGNQITVITHSPKFLDHGLLDPDSQSMLTMVTQVDGESSVASPTSSGIRLKPHMFMPDVFFANAAFLVEGAKDEFVIKAISDAFDGIFNKHEIILVNCGGFGGIKLHTDLLDAYSIKYYGLADKEYERNDAITVLDDDLEDELRKIKTAPFQVGDHQPKKPDVEVYYSYITGLLETKEGFEELEQTKIWASIEDVMNGLNVDMSVFKKKYEA